jgi:DNA-binding XRE family transcriptional regulator
MKLIKSEKEYKRLKEQVERNEKWIQEERERLTKQGMKPELIQIAVGIAEGFTHNWRKELEEYERTVNGDFDPHTCSLDDIGRHLIRLRLWKGLTQEDLAKRLGVTNSQVSKDERFEYQGASMEKIKKVLKALEVDLIFASPKVVEIATKEFAAGQDEMAATG